MWRDDNVIGFFKKTSPFPPLIGWVWDKYKQVGGKQRKILNWDGFVASSSMTLSHSCPLTRIHTYQMRGIHTMHTKWETHIYQMRYIVLYFLCYFISLMGAIYFLFWNYHDYLIYIYIYIKFNFGDLATQLVDF